mgnify:CR=1 FL=1
MTTTIKINHPATKAFVTALLGECAKLGLAVLSLDPTTESGLKENGGWCFLRLEGDHANGASLIIPKAVTRLGNLHSHVDLMGKDGYIPLPKKNGKVVCHFAPDVEKVKKVLPAFLSAAKRATAAPTPKTTVSAPVNPLLAEPTEEELNTLAPLTVSPESWAELADSEEAEYQTQS